MTIELPKPKLRGTLTLEEALTKRRSNRHYRDESVEEAQLSQLLWAAQGIRDASGARTAPSAGQRYPLEIYRLTGEGTYHYIPEGHSLEQLGSEDLREALFKVARNQEPIRDAPISVVIAAEYARAEHEYGEARAVRFAHMEAGHVAQNILLQAYALGLSGAGFGAFEDEKVSEVLSLPEEHAPLYIIPVGRSK